MKIRIQDGQGPYPDSKQVLLVKHIEYDNYTSLPGEINVFIVHYLTAPLLDRCGYSGYCVSPHPTPPDPMPVSLAFPAFCQQSTNVFLMYGILLRNPTKFLHIHEINFLA
jgi:hypothetical protein